MPSWWPKKGSSVQFRAEKVFWASMVPAALAWDLLFPASWGKWGSQLIAQLSIYALVKGAGGQEQAAKAKEVAGDEDG